MKCRLAPELECRKCANNCNMEDKMLTKYGIIEERAKNVDGYILHDDRLGYYTTKNEDGVSPNSEDASIITDYDRAKQLSDMCGFSMHEANSGQFIYKGRK